MPYRQHHGFIFSKGIKKLPSKASKRMQELHFPMLFSTYKKMGDSKTTHLNHYGRVFAVKRHIT